MRVNLINLSRQWEEDLPKLLPNLKKTLKSGQYVGGSLIEKIESKISKKIGVKYTVTLNSGTDALMMALWALGVKKNDEVITQSNSFIATAGSIVHLGAKPVFADVKTDQMISPTDIENKITKKTKAIIPVHLTGRIADMKAINRISRKYKIPVIEDAAQAFGSKYNKLSAGALGTCGCFSAHPLKNLNATGDAGFLTTNNYTIYKKIKLYANHGLENRNNARFFGVNSRLDVLQANVIEYRLKTVEKIIKKRRNNANIYFKYLKNKNIEFIYEDKSNYHSYHLFVVKVKRNRNKLMKFLLRNGVQTSIHYPIPIHLQKASKKYGFKKGDLPNTELQAGQILSLPINQYITRKEIFYVIKLINKFYEK
tara:strand:- start:238 stop:1341 length:1104 start_codon:yes stop_codon:yes gene_type:complete